MIRGAMLEATSAELARLAARSRRPGGPPLPPRAFERALDARDREAGRLPAVKQEAALARLETGWTSPEKGAS